MPIADMPRADRAPLASLPESCLAKTGVRGRDWHAYALKYKEADGREVLAFFALANVPVEHHAGKWVRVRFDEVDCPDAT